MKPAPASGFRERRHEATVPLCAFAFAVALAFIGVFAAPAFADSGDAGFGDGQTGAGATEIVLHFDYSDRAADGQDRGGATGDPRQLGADGTAFGKGASLAAVQAAIANMKSDDDPKGTVFRQLRLRSGKVTKSSIALKWKRVSGASRYLVYGSRCGKANKLQPLYEVTKVGRTVKGVGGKKLKAGKYYKFMVIALDTSGNVASSSKIVHVATKGGKVGNYKALATAKKKVTLKAGKKAKLKVRATFANTKLKPRQHRKTAYESSNPAIVKVTSKGVVRGVSKGTASIYAYTQNGIFKRVKVNVK